MAVHVPILISSITAGAVAIIREMRASHNGRRRATVVEGRGDVTTSSTSRKERAKRG